MVGQMPTEQDRLRYQGREQAVPENNVPALRLSRTGGPGSVSAWRMLTGRE